MKIRPAESGNMPSIFSAGAWGIRPKQFFGESDISALREPCVELNRALTQLSARATPFLVNTLKPSAAWLENDYSFRVDGSLANYIGMTSGQYIPCEVHNLLPEKCHQNVPNIFNQLDVAGRTWKTWLEGGTARCDTGSGSTCSR